MQKDYYEILGVAKNAGKEDIKKAYHKLAHKFHPDKSGGDEKKFKEINEAYQVLINDKKRAEYDRYGRVFSDYAGGAAGQEGFGFDFSAGGGPSSGWDFGGFEDGFKDFDFSDVFGDFFGFQAGGRKRPQRGRDIYIDIEISFKEMVFGAERRVVLNKLNICEICNGGGAEPGSDFAACGTCQGSGTVRESRRSFFGSVTSLKECVKCRGLGKIPQKICKECRGAGVLRKNEEISIKVPAGIQNGEMIKFSGKGEAVSRGISGDLYVKVRSASHPLFVREGNNILMTLDIPISEVILGGERQINLLDEALKIKIPKGTDSEDILRIRGKGIVYDRGGRGDLLIKIKVRTPKKLSSRAKQLIEELQKEGI